MRDYLQGRRSAGLPSVRPRATAAARDYTTHRPPYLRATYHDRPDLIRHVPRHVHSYYDPYDRLCHRIIWPRYYYPVYYRFGHHAAYRHVYPYYHRKYVFVSLGGYWPLGCSYLRYYWYGWHPYVWYGYYPVAREVATQSDNYYTYNYYYGGDSTPTETYYGAGPATSGDTTYADHTTFADVRAKLEQQSAEPASQTVADTRFEEGVKSFEAGDYAAAAAKFATARTLTPEDAILPFAYAQALFANGQYSEAADVLRAALRDVSPEKEGVFYPRGLYPNDDVLFAQIEALVDRLEQFRYDADLQLLLGYHLLGVGETGYAREPLERAGQDQENVQAARVLLNLLKKIEAEAESDGDTSVSAPAATPAVATPAPVRPSPAPQAEAPSGVQWSDAATAASADDSSTTPVELPAVAPANAVPDAAGDVVPQDKLKIGPAQESQQPSDKQDEGGPPAVEPADVGSAAAWPQSPDGTDPVVARGARRSAGALRGYSRAGLAGLILLISLGSAASYLQWRFLDR